MENSKPVPNSTIPLISVAVCTYNRDELLTNVLQTLCQQNLEKTCYEIIVVDNNSSDNTRAVAEQFCSNHSNIHYCLETKQGLSNARNRGWQEALGDYVAYIDDDSKVPEQWLSVAKDIIDNVSPSVFGGPFYAFYNTPKPRWFKDCYGSYELGNEARALAKEFIFGGNIFLRRRLLASLGGFSNSFGMNGHKIGYGEEIVLQLKIRDTLSDQLFYYDPRLYVYHLVEAKKMTLRWRAQQGFAGGRNSYRVFNQDTRRVVRRGLLWKKFVKILLRFVKDVTFGLFLRDRRQYPYFQNYMYEYASGHLADLGRLREQFRQTRHQSQLEHRGRI